MPSGACSSVLRLWRKSPVVHLLLLFEWGTSAHVSARLRQWLTLSAFHRLGAGPVLPPLSLGLLLDLCEHGCATRRELIGRLLSHESTVYRNVRILMPAGLVDDQDGVIAPCDTAGVMIDVDVAFRRLHQSPRNDHGGLMQSVSREGRPGLGEPSGGSAGPPVAAGKTSTPKNHVVSLSGGSTRAHT